MSMVPDLEVVKYFLRLPFLARVLGCFAVLMLTAVFSVPLIKAQGTGSYYVVIAAVAILSIILLFVTPQTEIRMKSERESDKDIQERTDSLQKEITMGSKKEAEIGTRHKAEECIVSVKQKTGREDALHKLTHGEKEFLAPYIFQDITSQNVDVMGGIYQSLYKKQILDPPPAVGYLTQRDVLIQDWAKEYLKAHPELLKGYEKVTPQEVPWWWW